MNLVVNLVFYLTMLAGALAGLAMIARLVVNVPIVGAALCLAPATWIYGGKWDLAVTEVANLHVYASDLVAIVLIGAALMQLNVFGEWAWPLAGITVLLGLSLLQGVALFGEAAAINEARGSIYLIAAVWWAVTVDWSRQDIVKAALVAGWFFVVLALLHLWLYGFGTVDSSTAGTSVDGSYRLLNSTQALALTLCAATVFFDRNRRDRPPAILFSAAIFTLVVIAAQNRSVWIALIGGLVAVLLLSPESDRRRQAFGSLALGGALAVLTIFGLIGGSIGTKLATAGTETGTWDWRLLSWRELLSSWLSGSPLSIAFGDPFGAGLARVINGRTTAVSAHNWYVELLLRIGIVGLLLWLVLIVRGIAHARKANMAALFLGAALLCYAIAYVLPWNVAPWLGILLTCNVLHGAGRSTAPVAPPAARRVAAQDRSQPVLVPSAPAQRVR